MSKPITNPNTFANQTGKVPASQIDADFATVIGAVNDLSTYLNFAVDGGTANNIVLSFASPLTITSYTNVEIAFQVAASNTGATNININGLGATLLVRPDGTSLQSGDLTQNQIYKAVFNPATGNFQLTTSLASSSVPSTLSNLTVSGFFNTTGKVTLASAATVAIGAANANYIEITGTTTITAFDSIANGVYRILKFDAALTLTQNAVSLILPTGANITTAAGDVAIFISEGSGNWRCVNYSSAALGAPNQPGRFLSTQVLTNPSGTYTPSAGTNSVLAWIVAGAGAGGGAQTTTASQVAAAGGGGCGAWIIHRATSGFSGASYTVGAGGTPAAGLVGGNGGNTTFLGCTANGGIGGPAGTASTSASTAGGALGGTGTGGNVANFSGASSQGIGIATIGNTANLAFSGAGASSPFGTGGTAVGGNTAGIAGAGLNSAGSGACNSVSQAARSGGAGTQGFIIVFEFS